MAANDDRVTLESFDGTDVAAYRKWKRRAQLRLAALPNTVPREKLGPRLMQYIKGEAELVCESIPVDKLCKEDGDQLVFALLDEKFGPQPTDLLHAALKEFFYELSVKNGETYQNFQARFFHANQKLEEQEVKLPAKVLGFMMVKKLRLDPTQESLLLTATKGSMDYKDVVAAVKSVFPEGKGASGKQSKEVFFTATADEGPDDENEDFQDAMEAVEDMQAQDLDEEDILDAYESYVEIRRRMAEKKKARGFTSSSSEAPKWRLTGTVNGRIEQLKAKTRCHLCHKVGHWRKECPLRGKTAGAGKGSRAAASTSSARASEANLVEETSDVFITEEGEAKDLLKRFSNRKQAWNKSLATDVGNPGFADSHSTGNRQRLACENGVFERWRHGRSRRDDGESPVVIASSPTLAFQGALQEVLSADAPEGSADFAHDVVLASCGVPDTACRRTLVGEHVLGSIAELLSTQGLSVKRVKCRNRFRFGNSGTLESEEVAILPAKVGSRVICVKAAVLRGHGSATPLLLSKELLRSLGAVLDMSSDSCYFRALGETVQLRETNRGHYGIPMFENVQAGQVEFQEGKMVASDCLESVMQSRVVSDQSYDISMLERPDPGEQLAVKDQEEIVPPPNPPRDHAERPAREGQQRHEGCCSALSRCDRRRDCGGHEGFGHRAGLRGRRGDRDQRQDDDAGGEVQVQKDICRRIPGGQELRGMASRARSQERPQRPAHAAQSVHSSSRLQQVQQAGSGRDLGEGNAKGSHLWEDEQSAEAPHREATRSSDRRPNADRGRRDSVDQSGRESQTGSQVGGHSRAEDGEAHRAEARHGQSDPSGSDEGPDAGGGGDEVKMNRKTRRKLRRAVESLAKGRPPRDEWKPEDTDTADVFHINMAQYDFPSSNGDIAEVFSLPRVVPRAEQKGLHGCRSYDIGNGWDFLKPEDRKRCREELEFCKPRMLIVSPPCGPFSSWQFVNSKYGRPTAREMVAARTLLDFACQLCEMQVAMNNYFVFEHPVSAVSWQEQCMEQLSKCRHVRDVRCDLCMFGLCDPMTKKPYQKRTKLRTNCSFVEELMSCTCDGSHVHQRLEGQTKVGGVWVNRTCVAQVYPQQFVDKLIQCTRKAVRERERERSFGGGGLG